MTRPTDPAAIDHSFRTRSAEHIARYIATNGAEGYDDNRHGAPTLLLTTIGHRTGKPHTAPLYFAEHDGAYLIIASKGGDDRDPVWYRNLVANPAVEVRIRERVFPATARTASPEEKARLWPLLAGPMPFYDEYQQRAGRDIPLVILEPDGTE